MREIKRAILFYNPISGNQSIALKLDSILERFQQEDVLLQPFCLMKYEKARLLDALHQIKPDFVIISGGDGTLNFVVCILQEYDPGIPVGIIPSGTCNDFASSLGIPSTVSECVDVILTGRLTEVDVGLINDRSYFLSTCAGGYFVDVSFNTNKDMKKNLGPLAYYLKAISEISQIKPIDLKIYADNQCAQMQALLFLITNGCDAGGFKNIVNEADYSDGIMDIIVVKFCSPVELASLLLKVLNQDTQNDKNILKIRTQSCVIESSSSISLSIDGEKGDGLPISVKFLNKRLKVFTPKKRKKVKA